MFQFLLINNINKNFADVATDQFISTAVISGNPKGDEPEDTDPALMSTFVVGRGSSMPDLTVVGSGADLAKTCNDISGAVSPVFSVC